MRVLSTDSVRAEAEPGAALAALKEQGADLILIDPGAPESEGLATIREIRRAYPTVRVIAMSGGAQSGLASYRPHAISTIAYLAACSMAGAHATLAKPFDAPQLRELIHKVMEAAGA
jgi:CheY-like chemotaxis protein